MTADFRFNDPTFSGSPIVMDKNSEASLFRKYPISHVGAKSRKQCFNVTSSLQNAAKLYILHLIKPKFDPLSLGISPSCNTRTHKFTKFCLAL
jgi:hypothetical protein